MNHLISCPLCSSESIHFLYRCRDNLVTRKEFDIYACSECRICFTQDRPDENDISGYYESDEYVSHDDKAKGFLNRIYFLSRNFMIQKKRIIVEKASGVSNGTLLDIGCGTGHFAGTMKKEGWIVTGIEPNKKAAEYATASFGLDVFGPGRIKSLPDSSYDCITLWHVLEHFYDPVDYMKDIYRLLKPDGTCFIALPNCSSADAEYYKSSWAAWDVPRHLWHFNPESFVQFTGSCGFHIIGVKRLPLDVFYISVLSEKQRRSRMAIAKGFLSGIRFSLISIRDINKCSSLVYFVKKQHKPE